MYDLRPPADELTPFIENYWEVTSSEDEPVDLRVDVFVDGRADLVFNYGAAYTRSTIGGDAREITASNFDAQRLVPIRIEQSGAVHIVGVRFRLGGAGAFAAVPLRASTGKTVAPDEVFSGAGELEAALKDAPGLDARARLLDAYFLERRTSSPAFATFTRALDRYATGAPPVARVAAEVGVSARHLERLFARFLGLPPRTVGRIQRFQGALRMLMRDPGCTLAEVAANADYFDQAHFIREFREMTGGVPRGYRGYYPPDGPDDFAPNVVVFIQEDEGGPG